MLQDTGISSPGKPGIRQRGALAHPGEACSRAQPLPPPHEHGSQRCLSVGALSSSWGLLMRSAAAVRAPRQQMIILEQQNPAHNQLPIPRLIGNHQA